MKYIAVYDIHNSTGDFITQFDGSMIGELSANPSRDGICFFRFHGAMLQQQIKFFHELHKQLRKERGEGLSAVVIPHGLCGQEIEFAHVFRGAKISDPSIKTIFVTPEKRGHDFGADHLFRKWGSDDAELVQAIKRLIGLKSDYKEQLTAHDLTALQENMEAMAERIQMGIRPAPSSSGDKPRP